MSCAPRGSTPAAALAKAQAHVRVAAAHYCHVPYAAQLTAAKAALTQSDRQQALQHLREADETLAQCPAPPVAEPQHDQEESDRKDALAHR